MEVTPHTDVKLSPALSDTDLKINPALSVKRTLLLCLSPLSSVLDANDAVSAFDGNEGLAAWCSSSPVSWG